MRTLRTMVCGNQNTNSATEAWHLTLKKMITRKLGDIGGLRLDRIIDLLFCYMWPFFLYALRCKQLGLLVNYKVEEVVLSSLHLAQHEMKYVKVSTQLSCSLVFMSHSGCVYVKTSWCL